MQAFPRVVVAMVLGGIAAIIIRLKGASTSPAQDGAWRQLTGDEFR